MRDVLGGGVWLLVVFALWAAAVADYLTAGLFVVGALLVAVVEPRLPRRHLEQPDDGTNDNDDEDNAYGWPSEPE
jgi:hypothetical protein